MIKSRLWFLATGESDFHKIWKEGIVEAGDRSTLKHPAYCRTKPLHNTLVAG